MRPIRQIPRPQSVFNAPAKPRGPFCGYCGSAVTTGPDGVRVHLKDDGSGALDAEMDLDHWAEPEDFREPD